ncbi:MAG: hypothetical protein UY09_C0026G0010, partial [Parcubacteria group bacterium GW2011_GWA2_47_8]
MYLNLDRMSQKRKEGENGDMIL